MQRFLACLCLLAILTACAENTARDVPAPLVPYQTAPPSATPTLIPPLMEVILPSPTTFNYVVVQGDTLIGIATRYSVALEALLAANPGIQAVSLPVGTSLIIPAGNQIKVDPTPTPAPLQLQHARCWPESDGGLWCFALLRNEYAETLENISAQFTLLDANGQGFYSQTAFSLLNTLPPGAAMPLAIHFPPNSPADVSPSRAGTGTTPRVQVLTAIRLLPGDARYLPVMPGNTLVSVDASGRTAQVSGQVILIGAGTASILWVLATAYDSTGNVVGVRRWESTSPLTVDAPVSFDFLLSSVGPGITRVEFLAEARP
jgi:hypothetical protein